MLLCFLIFLYYFKYYFVCVNMCTHAIVNMQRSEDNLFKSVLPFYHAGNRESTSGYKTWQRVLSPAELSQQRFVFEHGLAI